jgi:mannose-6-phosphate isomerase-like protein (cupin superfamily)
MQTEPYSEDRPWGGFIRFSLNEPSTVKILTVKTGEAFSLQSHEHRSEEWFVISGKGTIEIGDDIKEVQTGHTYLIPPNTKHRLAATEEKLVVLEIARGEFDEGDITRFEDRYGRLP